MKYHGNLYEGYIIQNLSMLDSAQQEIKRNLRRVEIKQW